MVSPVTFNDIGMFLNNMLLGFDEFIVLSFVMMSTFSIMLFIRRLLVGVNS